MPTPARVSIVTALPSEARALVEHFALKRERDKPFLVFSGDRLRVVVSGMGVAASAAAVGFGAGLVEGAADDIWINFGIAGHRDLPCGSAVLAARVRHHADDTAWYPGVAFANSLPLVEIVSHDRPVTTYPSAVCCDMEAAGFISAASRVANGELIGVMKVISDNAESGLAHIDRDYVRALVEARIPALETIIAALRTCASMVRDSRDGDALERLGEWHFTTTQRHQAERLLQRIAVLTAGTGVDAPDLASARTARDVIARLEQTLAALSPRFE